MTPGGIHLFDYRAYPLRCQVWVLPVLPGYNPLFGWIKPRLVSIYASLRYLRSLAILRALEVSP